MSTRIPPLLEPYLTLPPETSLILLTSVLGASTNWLILRFLYSNLQTPPSGNDGGDDDTKVLLVSFMRDYAFWKEGSRRLGVELDKLAAKKRFSFLDGLSGLFSSESDKPKSSGSDGVIRSTELGSLSKQILGAVEAMQQGSTSKGRTVLVIDQLDLLLAACGNKITPVALGDMLLDVREHVHATVISLLADDPLVTAQHTPLETNHAIFLLSLAHQAELTISLRLLDTGTAKDVSGVVRITAKDQSEDKEGKPKQDGKELLYYVGGDGGVRVFERGQ